MDIDTLEQTQREAREEFVTIMRDRDDVPWQGEYCNEERTHFCFFGLAFNILSRKIPKKIRWREGNVVEVFDERAWHSDGSAEDVVEQWLGIDHKSVSKILKMNDNTTRKKPEEATWDDLADLLIVLPLNMDTKHYA